MVYQQDEGFVAAPGPVFWVKLVGLGLVVIFCLSKLTFQESNAEQKSILSIKLAYVDLRTIEQHN